MKSRKINPVVLTVTAIVVVAVLLWVFPKGEPSDPVENDKVETVEEQPETKSEEQSTSGDEARDKKKAMAKAQAERNIQSLELMLDEVKENEEEALRLAQKMIEKGNKEERIAAAEAFKWIGGKESINVLISSLDEHDGDVRETIANALRHSLQTNDISKEYTVTEENWLDIFAKLPHQSDFQPFMMILTLPEDDNAYLPLLLKLARSENKELAEEALANISSCAGGLEMPDVDAAEKWYKEHSSKDSK